MNDDDSLTTEDLAHQVRQHAESLRAAGVAFLPTRTALALPVVAAPAESAPVTPGVLFDAGEPEPRRETLTVEQRLQELQALRQRVAACERCPQLARTRKQTVFGVGALDPDVCFVGE